MQEVQNEEMVLSFESRVIQFCRKTEGQKIISFLEVNSQKFY